jgi:YVTN family beta-propeller protein
MNATRKWLSALACAVAAMVSGAPSASAAGPRAYVANFETNNVTVIDAASHAVIATVPVGSGPFGVAATPDGRFVYVTNSGGPAYSVSVIDTATNAVIATVPATPTPLGVAVSPDGRFAYALIDGTGVAYAIDTATNAVAATAAIGSSSGAIALALTPDGRLAYVANAFLNTVSVLDVASGATAATVPVGNFPFDVAVTPDGRRAYVANRASIENALSVIDTGTQAVIASVALEEVSQGIAIHPDGRLAYVTQGMSNTVAVVDLATNQRIAAVAAGLTPARVAVSPDGRFAYVTNQDSANVSVIDTATSTVVAWVPVGPIPQGIAFANVPQQDTVAPATAADAAPPAGAAGWNNSAVSVNLSATDNEGGSGIESIAYTVVNGQSSGSGTVLAATATISVAAEGVNTVTYRATDKAGNVEAAKTVTVRIDRSAPASSATRTPAPDAGGANTTPVTVTVGATDNAGGGGVQSISVLRTTATGTTGETFPGASATFVVSAQGTTSVAYHATDNAGNVEPAKSLTIRIEAAPAPAFSASVSVWPPVLWPPDRRFDAVQAQVKSKNAVGRVRIKSVSVASDESVGRNSPDWIVKGSSVKLRAERDDRGNGRVYTLTYTLVDEAGNTTRAVDTVKVPKYLHWGHWGHDHRR